MGDIAKRKAWQQDPKLHLCTILPDLELVLQKVRRQADVTPGLLSRLYHSEYPAFADAGKRKLNSTANPNDLACLGEDSIGSDMKHQLLTPELNLVRKPNSFVGLKNLGATCYMNCMLQALFHNTAFRAGLYEWKPPAGEEPSPIIRELQLLFAFLQRGERAYYDPTPFTTEIGLAPQVQQDVQEFFKALSTYLEEQFGKSSNSVVRTLVQDQFSGTMAYVTQCKTCQTASKTRSLFYELDMTIDNVPSIERSIENYIKSEELSGSNQYHCGHCDAKRDAERFIELDSLPPNLNFQLMRFVFDWETETKKKVKTSVEFPEMLDMSAYVRSTSPSARDQGEASNALHGEANNSNGGANDSSRRRKQAKQAKPPPSSLQYQLSYVLVHRGQSAYGGHYIAFVRDQTTAKWWKFNDEEAEPVTDLAKALASNTDIAPGVIKTSKKSASQASEVIDVDATEEDTPKLKKGTSKKSASNSTSSRSPADNRYKSGSAYMLGYTRIGVPAFETVIPEDIVEAVDTKNAAFQHVIDEQKLVMKTIGEMVAQRKALRDQILDVGLLAHPDDPSLPVLPNSPESVGEAQVKAGSKLKKKAKEVALEKDLTTMTNDEIQDHVTDQLEDCQWISTEWWTAWLKGGKIAHTGLEESNETKQSSMDLDVPDASIVASPTVSEGPIALPNSLLMCRHGRLDPLKVPIAKRISPQAWELLADFSCSIGPSLDKHAMCTECAYQIIRYGADKNESEISKNEFLSALKTTDSSSHGIEPTFWISKDWLALYSKKTMKNSELDQTINSSLQCPHGKLSPDSKIRRRIPATQWVTLKSTFPAALEFPSVLTTAAVPKLLKEGAKSTSSKSASKYSAVQQGKLAGSTRMDKFVVKKSASLFSGFTAASAIDLEENTTPDAPHAAQRSIGKPVDAVVDIFGDDTSQPSDTSPSEIEGQAVANVDAEADSPNNENTDPSLSDENPSNDIGTNSEVEDDEQRMQLGSKMDTTTPHHSQGSVSQGSATSVVSPATHNSTPKAAKPTASKPPTSSSKGALPAHVNQYSEEEAELKDVCQTCYHDMQEDSQARSQMVKEKTSLRRKFKPFLENIPSSLQMRGAYNYCPLPTKPGEYYLVSLSWAIEWRAYLKDNENLKRPGRIDNSVFFCHHGKMVIRPFSLFADPEKNVFFAVTTKAMWDDLRKEYGSSRSVCVVLGPDNRWDFPHMCEECMDAKNVEKEVKAIHFSNSDLYLVVEDCRSNKRRKTKLQENAMSKSRGSKKNFLPNSSYFDHVGITKMKIFERYEVEPIEIVLLTPDGKVLDNDEKTLEEYGVRDDQPLTVRLVDPVEREVYRAVDERNAGFGATVLMGGQKRNVPAPEKVPARVSPSDADADAPTDDEMDPSPETETRTSSQMDLSQPKHVSEVIPMHEAESDESDARHNGVGLKTTDRPKSRPNLPKTALLPDNEVLEEETDSSFASIPSKSQQNREASRDSSDWVILGAKSATTKPNSSSHDNTHASTARPERKSDTSAHSREVDLPAELDRDSSTVGVSSWKCSSCGQSNSGYLPSCENCDTPSSTFTWKCSDCNIPIRAELSKCPQCHISRFQGDHDDEEEDDIPTKHKRAGSRSAASKRNHHDEHDEDFEPHDSIQEKNKRGGNVSASKKRKAKTDAEELEEAEASERSSKRSKR